MAGKSMGVVGGFWVIPWRRSWSNSILPDGLFRLSQLGCGMNKQSNDVNRTRDDEYAPRGIKVNIKGACAHNSLRGECHKPTLRRKGRGFKLSPGRRKNSLIKNTGPTSRKEVCDPPLLWPPKESAGV